MSDELQREQDRALVELAAEKLLKTSAGAVQEKGREHYVQSQTRGSGTPVVVDDIDRPSCVIEAFAPHYEFVLEHLALVGSPRVGLAVAAWLSSVARRWGESSSDERRWAVDVAAELLKVKKRDLGFGRHQWVPIRAAASEAA
ncbi:hypothetical protein [Streptomyces sp. CB03238]|uniref:hypothetical protein n=1 Tax=Streptomyces sp. CB03238 TaxID=1907777 RepID=UPI000A108C13|nr:hypothetical protein [Streptomyces sp. CB03238]ORT58130.1 hypothetical protein BKD26_19700 [Streptomyces sp. CB03238]